MSGPRRFKGPYSNPAFPRQVNEVVMPPMVDMISGEVTADSKHRVLGIPRFPGHISGVHLSCAEVGIDDTDALYFEGDVMINGVSCLTTKPRLTAPTATGGQRTTFPDAGDSGVTDAVLNTSNSFTSGDIITWNLEITRSTPGTEINNPGIIVELEFDD